MARIGHCVVQIKETVWVTGGDNDGNLFGDIWQLSLETLQWSRLRKELPLPVANHATTVTDEGKMVVFGGLVADKDNRLSYTNSVYTTWLKVPTLRTLAWDAFCQHVPDMSSVPASTLRKWGVPRDCVELLGSCNDA